METEGGAWKEEWPGGKYLYGEHWIAGEWRLEKDQEVLITRVKVGAVNEMTNKGTWNISQRSLPTVKECISRTEAISPKQTSKDVSKGRFESFSFDIIRRGKWLSGRFFKEYSSLILPKTWMS